MHSGPNWYCKGSFSIWLIGCLNARTNCSFCSFAVKIVGKLEDGTVFVKKGHDGDEPLEFKTDEGNLFFSLMQAMPFIYFLFMCLSVKVSRTMNRTS